MTPRNFALRPVLTPDELFSTFTQQIVPCTMYPCPMYPITLSRIRDVRFVHFQKGDEGPGSQTEFRLLILGSFRISISLLGAGVHVHSQQFGKFGLPSFFAQ